MKTSLLFGIHCHQPIDNFDKVIYEIIEKSYKPFFMTLKNYPEFKCSVHFSGWLFEFIKEKDKELFALIKKLSPQIEFFTGGYYEPILASISSKNRVKQIKKLSLFIEENFNQTPRGLWLTERIWDDSIIDDLKICGIEYVIVDDYHLIASGFNKDNLKGYFLTENSNNQMALFPISKDLRYIIPFATIDKTLETLNSFKNIEGKNAAIIFDDGEKFGVWPKTYEKVYEKKWLKTFFEKCIEDETIEINTFSEFYDKNKAISLSYLPTVSYHEMGEWSILPEISNDYLQLVESHKHKEYLIRGGIWKNFFIKYNESNWIHKRSLELSKMDFNDKNYEESLYKTQCNDVLWHGVFGGVYLPNLRDNAFKYIIDCENILDINNKCIVKDINLDSYEEYKFYTSNFIIIIDPKKGAQIVELDLKDKYFNLINTLSRYEEPYYSKIKKIDENIENENVQNDEIATIHDDNLLSTTQDIKIYTDWYHKKSSIDHISDLNFNLKSFESCTFNELSDFTNEEFEVVKFNKNSMTLEREGGIYKDKKYSSNLTKKYKFDEDIIKTSIKLTSKYESKLLYIHEYNFHFEDYEAITINGHAVNEAIKLENSQLTIIDQSLDKTILFYFDQCVDIYIYPVKSVSQSEAGVDFTIQGICFGFAKEFTKNLDLQYTLTIN